MKRLNPFLLIGLLTPGWLAAAPVLNPLFSDGAVLQRNRPLPVWGQADPGENVTVTLGQEQAQTKADGEGNWRVEFSAQKTGGPFVLIAKTPSGMAQSQDVMIGDVWLCTGQSNMYWSMSKSLDAKAALKQVNNPSLRLFTVRRAASTTPKTKVQGFWMPANPRSAASFSAVGYYFGERLQRETGLPIGLIQSTVGGTLASNWTSEAVLRANPDAASHFERFARESKTYPERLAAYQKEVKTNPKATKPKEPERRQPAGYYNAMIHPLHGFPIAGVIWYQGESDSWRYRHYKRFLRDLIADWRTRWDQAELPFLIVQLPGFEGKKGVNENFPPLREIQRQVAGEPNNGLAVTIDLGLKDDIHPPNKKPVGERLAATALAQVYGREIAHHGPKLVGAKRQDKGIALVFDSGGGALVDRDGGGVLGFEVAGADGVFQPVSATIQGEQILLPVPEPETVTQIRYAWTGFPPTDFYNEADLPASPFHHQLP